MCFILCLCCKVYLGDSFVLHTSSMEPTMIGRRSGGDRIVVSKLHTDLAAPDRFTVLLFQYPNNLTTHYMKRAVGVGGEQLFIRGGDLWVSDLEWAGSLEEGRRAGRVTIVRKPRRTGEAFLDSLPVIAAKELINFDAELWRRHCEVAEGDPAAWTVGDGHLSVEAAEAAFVRLRREARDVIMDAAAPATRERPGQPVAGGKHPVGDLSLRVDVRSRSNLGRVVLRIADGVGGHVVSAEIATEGSDRTTRILIDDRVLGTSNDRLTLNAWTSLRLDNVDDRVRLLFDGREVLVRDYTHTAPEEGSEAALPACRAGFGVEPFARADFRPVALHRDISYVAEGITRFLIPEGSYVVLGDNTGSSADSRSWKRVAIRVRRTGEILEGDAHGVTSTATMLHESNPWMEPDGSYRFADRSGRVHVFQDRTEWTEVGTWPSPYVQREWILGRGVCVLWPLDRFSWLR